MMEDSMEEGIHDKLYLPKPPNFSLEKAVCSYGFFMTSPNLWINYESSSSLSSHDEVVVEEEKKQRKSAVSGMLQRPLRLVDGRSVLVQIYEVQHKICVSVLRSPQNQQQLSDEDKDFIVAQTTRMLRLSEVESAAITEFHHLHPQAKEEGFGRLFRSPTLFEDMVKSLLLCNCGWGRTLAMATALCELNADLRGLPSGSEDKLDQIMLSPKTPESRDLKRRRNLKNGRVLHSHRSLNFGDGKQKEISIVNHTMSQELESKTTNSEDNFQLAIESVKSSKETAPTLGNFPSPEELCELDVNFLSRQCGLGYRAQWIWKLAKDVSDGTIDLQALEMCSLDEARNMLRQLHGFGPFTCANVLTCMGKYDTIPIDTETVRHIQQAHGRSRCNLRSVSKDVAEVFSSYTPYQFLGYWFELWSSYERRFGKLSCMDPCDYGRITGHNMRNKRIA